MELENIVEICVAIDVAILAIAYPMLEVLLKVNSTRYDDLNVLATRFTITNNFVHSIHWAFREFLKK